MNGISFAPQRPAESARAGVSTDAAPAPAPTHGAGIALAAGQVLLRAGQRGPLWRVLEGWLALAWAGEPQHTPTHLAGPGDLVGLQALGSGAYAEGAQTLMPVRLQPAHWQDDAGHRQLLHAALQQQQRQAIDMARLRTGNVRERMRYLLALWAPAAGALDRQALPPLKVLARIVDSAPETVCRELRLLLPGRSRAASPRRRTATRRLPAVPAGLAAQAL